MQVNKFWLGPLDLNQKVHIYGGGISGLLAAYRLKNSGVDFTLYEKSDRLGGKLQSEVTEYGVVEWAANAIVDSPEVQKLLIDLELSPIKAAPGLKRCLYRNGKIKSFPAVNFFELLKIFTNLFKTIPIGGETNTLKTTFTPLLGEKLCDELLTPIFRGVYATGSENLHSNSVIPGLKEFEGLPYHNFITTKMKNRTPMQSLSFKNGMQEFIDALAYSVEENCKLNSVEGLRDNALICTDPKSAADLIGASAPELSTPLRSFKSVPIHSATYFFKNEVRELKSCFGLLFNEIESPNIMGILVNHEIFPQRENPYFSYTLISKAAVHSFKDVPVLNQYNDFLVHKMYNSHSYGLPLYGVERLELVEKLKNNKRFGFFGNYTDLISLRGLVQKITPLFS